MSMIKAKEKITTFTNKLSNCICLISSGNYTNFLQLCVVSNGKISLPTVIKIYKHLQVLYVSPSTDTFNQDFCFTRLDARPIYF